MQKDYPVFALAGQPVPPRCKGTVANGGNCQFPGAPMRWKYGKEKNGIVTNPMIACHGCYKGLLQYNAALDEADKQAQALAAKEAPKGLALDFEKSKKKQKKADDMAKANEEMRKIRLQRRQSCQPLAPPPEPLWGEKPVTSGIIEAGVTYVEDPSGKVIKEVDVIVSGTLVVPAMEAGGAARNDKPAPAMEAGGAALDDETALDAMDAMDAMVEGTSNDVVVISSDEETALQPLADEESDDSSICQQHKKKQRFVSRDSEPSSDDETSQPTPASRPKPSKRRTKKTIKKSSFSLDEDAESSSDKGESSSSKGGGVAITRQTGEKNILYFSSDATAEFGLYTSREALMEARKKMDAKTLIGKLLNRIDFDLLVKLTHTAVFKWEEKVIALVQPAAEVWGKSSRSATTMRASMRKDLFQEFTQRFKETSLSVKDHGPTKLDRKASEERCEWVLKELRERRLFEAVATAQAGPGWGGHY